MPSNHLSSVIPFSYHLQSFPASGCFSMSWFFPNESVLPIRWPNYWSFSFSIIPSKEIPGLISFRMDWLDLLAVQGTLKNQLYPNTKQKVLKNWVCLRFQMYSIIFWFTNDIVKIFSLFSNYPSLKHWHVEGKINPGAWLFHGHFLPVICSFRGWIYNHWASYILCRTLWKMKTGTLCSKIIKNFCMAAAEHEAKSQCLWSLAPCVNCRGYTAMTPILGGRGGVGKEPDI